MICLLRRTIRVKITTLFQKKKRAGIHWLIGLLIYVLKVLLGTACGHYMEGSEETAIRLDVAEAWEGSSYSLLPLF